jgi:hypothetical protein
VDGRLQPISKPMPAETPTARWPCPLRASRTVALTVAIAALIALSASPARADAPSFAGASRDADTVFFTSAEKFVPGDTDLKEDVYERSFDEGLGIYVTREISTGPTGGNDAFDASFRGVSEDGKIVFFSTDESLVAVDKDQARDVYVRLGLGGTALVSRPDPSCPAVNCGNANAAASFLGTSVDGNRVFFSTDEQLTSEDTDASFDIYERTLSPAATELVSRPAPGCVGTCGNGIKPSIFEGVSADGNRVAFSTAESLALEDGDQLEDVYQRDLGTSKTALVSTPGTCPGARQCDAVYRGASSSGNRVFFQTSEQIGIGDEDEEADVYAWSGTSASLVSRADLSCVGACGQGPQPTTYVGSSQDGRRVFLVTGEALTNDDGDAITDVYVRDLLSGTTELVSVPGTCAPGLDCDAFYQGSSANGDRVFFQSGERAATGDTDSATDVFMRNLSPGTTTLVSVPVAGCPAGCGNGPADSRFAGATPDGGVAFFASAESLSAADGDKSADVYARDLGSEPPATALVSPKGICPLSGEAGCDVTFDATSEDGAAVVFSTVKRLTAEDVDSTSDIYELSQGGIRLVSAGNSVEIGPSTPILTGSDPASPNPSTEPRLLGHAGNDTAIKVYPTADCSGAPIAIGSAEELEGSGVGLKVKAGSTTTFRATASDASGDTSGCSATAVSYTQADAGSGEAGGGGGGGNPAPAPATAGDAGIGPSKPGRTAPGVAGGHEVPLTRITFAPASRTRSRRPVFRFTDSSEQAGTNFQCKIDRRGWRGCGSPLRLKRLSLGAHSFRVKGFNSGLVEAVPAIRNFRVVAR